MAWNNPPATGSIKLLIEDAEAQVRLYNDTIDNFQHRLVLSARDRGYTTEEIAAFLEISVGDVETYFIHDPDFFEAP